jgi:hypothetical protein
MYLKLYNLSFSMCIFSYEQSKEQYNKKGNFALAD